MKYICPVYTASQEKILLEQAKQFIQKGNTKTWDKNDIKPIIQILNYADWKYYVKDNPVLADKEYDTLFALLKKIESENPNLILADSPSQRVAKGLNPDFKTVPHLVPMLSLDNSYNADDLQDWHERNLKLLSKDQEEVSVDLFGSLNVEKNPVIEYCVEPKFDGASISLIYEKDQLYRGATRGNGVQGDDITTNTKQIKSIPLSANFSLQGIEQIEMRGEVVIQKEKFARFNEKLMAENKSPMANPRNAASGSLRMKDPNEVAKRNLDAFVYQISNVQGETPFKTHYESLEYLSKKGFRSSFEIAKVFSKIEEVIQYAADFEEKRDDLPYEIDGLVIKVNSFEQQEIIGQTSHHPRWAMAYKFKARQATSKLLNIEYQVGRTGSITPVAKIEPVYVGGVTISSLSLFNEDIIREKDMRVGDTVLIERAGDVIPYVVKSFPELRDGSEQEVIFPKSCPICETILEKPEEEAVWRCPNYTDCAAQVAERIIHFASKNAMDIRGLGESNIRKFFELGLLNDLPGVYRLPYNKIKTMEGFGTKSIEKMQEAIEKTKSQALHRLIFGLGIRYVGETTAKNLAREISNLNELSTKSEEELLAIEDIGSKVAASIIEFFTHEGNIALLKELEALGLNFENQQKTEASGELSGKTFLFTGTLPTLKRKQAEEMAEAKGGKILSGVSTKLDYLIAGEKAGSKLEKAKKLGSVNIISEEEFIKLVSRFNLK